MAALEAARKLIVGVIIVYLMILSLVPETKRRRLGLKHAVVVVVEEIFRVGTQLRLEFCYESVSDAVCVIHLLLVCVHVKQVNVVREDLGWGRFVA